MDRLIEFEKLEEFGKVIHHDWKIIHAHGCFDRLHVGHIQHLQAARKLDPRYGYSAYPEYMLFLTITDDQHIRQNKGSGRPYCNQQQRAEALLELRCVDFVCIIPTGSGLDAIEAIKPDIFVKGEEYKNVTDNPSLNEEMELVKHHGGKTVFVGSELPELSTSIISAAGESVEAFDFLMDFARRSDKTRLFELIDLMSQKRVLVLGDGIYDMTTYVSIGDKAPKTTILPMLHKSWEQQTIRSPGGAYFIANTAAGLCDDICLYTGYGQLECIEGMRSAPVVWSEIGMDSKVIPSHWGLIDRCPTTKWRFREQIFTEQVQRQTLAQLVTVSQEPYPEDVTKAMYTELNDRIPDYDVAIIADFGHGFCSPELYKIMGQSELFVAAMVQANESNFGMNTIWKVPKADFLCIDDVELRLAFGDEFAAIGGLADVLRRSDRYKTIAVTQGKRGCLMNTPNMSISIPSIKASVVDRIGAGDSFYVTATLALSAGATPSEAGLLANISGSLACAVESNTAAIQKEQIVDYINRLFR